MKPGGPEEHEPVLLKEVIHYLNPQPGDAVCDCTVGFGGHSSEIIKLLGVGGSLIGIDLNLHALESARRRIEQARTVPAHIKLVQGNFADLIPLLSHAQAPPLGGILLDLGLSTPQLIDVPGLGMSWESDAALDMRLDPSADSPPAAEIVNTWTEDELTRLFRDVGEEKWSRRIARRILEARTKKPIETGRELGEIIAAAIPRKAWPPKIHPATRCFMALRIEVNREFENLEKVLPQAVEALKPGGRLVVISFHSGEDRRVKRFFQEMARVEEQAPWPLPQQGPATPPRLKILTPKPVTPSEEEIARNPRSRSAKLRAAEKVW